MKSKLYLNSKCLFCGESKFKFFDSDNGWKIDRCKKCGYIFTNPRPADDNIADFYNLEYFKDERHRDSFFNKDGTIKYDSENYINRIKIIESFVKERGRILEIGAAYGDFLVQLKERGWDAYGIEISKDAAKIAYEKNNINLFIGTLETLEIKEKFDVICLFQTLEHLPDPLTFLKKAYELLNIDGILVVEVPNVKSFDMLLSKERKRLSFDLPRHISHFYPQFLKKELKKIGLKTIFIDKYYPTFILKILQRKKEHINELNKTLSKEKNVYELFRDETTWKGLLLRRITHFFPGWRFTIIAKK